MITCEQILKLNHADKLKEFQVGKLMQLVELDQGRTLTLDKMQTLINVTISDNERLG